MNYWKWWLNKNIGWILGIIIVILFGSGAIGLVILVSSYPLIGLSICFIILVLLLGSLWKDSYNEYKKETEKGCD